jgi:AraC-like DNA-binding protein
MALIDVIGRGAVLPRHRHDAPYAAVVLEGGYEEAGDGGRFRAQAGDVLIHGAFSAHLDRADRRTTVLNLPAPWLWMGGSTRMSVDDPDAVARQAERDLPAAGPLLFSLLRPAAAGLDEETDALAGLLTGPDGPPLSVLSDERGVARGTLWRRFRSVYGVSPTRYRIEARARRAWRRLAGGADVLSEIALTEGFADQAHMTRDVRALTGRTPGQWRGLRHSFKTAAG